MTTVKLNRVKVGTEYMASGYGRGKNTRNVYLINGFFYAYHPAYAETQYTPLEGELKGYIPVNKSVYGDKTVYFWACDVEQVKKYDGHNFHREAEPKEHKFGVKMFTGEFAMQMLGI
jgi:hypothetical protein